jgi:hypothetical protein
MKNIHLIPTDKPSRLHLGDSGLVLCDFYFSRNTINGQNIYITSDEEIKDGDWYYTNRFDIGIAKNEGDSKIERTTKSYKKIILTTDQDLIKDGVQDITDEFLEWFVKNPSCEYVKTDLVPINEFGSEITVGGYGFDKFKYKIIPQEEPKFGDSIEKSINIMSIANDMFGKKEEPKQENRKVCKCKRAYENPLSEICSLCWNELYPNEKDEIKEEDLLEPKQETCTFCEGTGQIVSSTTISGFKTCDCINIPKQEQKQHLIDLMRLDEQETLEEVIKQELENHFFSNISEIKQAEYFINFGAKWRQEQDKNKYSEEEVYNIVEQAIKNYGKNQLGFFDGGISNPIYYNLKKWFEQFKKK